MKPSRRTVGLAFQPASAQVLYQPLGVVGVIVPWNYPLLLAIGPLTCALAAGNRVMLKLSEASPASGQALKTLLERVFPADLVSVVLGEVVRSTEETLALVECFAAPGAGACRIEPACELARVLDQALRAFLAVLDRHTLADVVRRRTALRQLLAIAR